MTHDPLAIAVSCTSLMTALTGALIAIFNRGKKSGFTDADINAVKLEQGNAKAERELLKTALGSHTTYIAKQEVINEAQGQINELRERRENDFAQRVSRCEAKVESKRSE